MSIFSRKNDMAISEAELSAMTAEMDMLHNETFPQVQKTLADVAANMAHLRTSEGFGRRGFLAGVGGVALVGGLAACSSSGGTKASTSPTASPSSSAGGSTTTTTSKYSGDTKIVALAAALENLAVAAYGLVLSNATKGKYGTVPPAIAQFVTTAMSQHMDHASGWNSVLTSAKLPAVKDYPLTIASGAVAQLSGATKLTDVATQALALENKAASTYLLAAENISTSNTAGVEVAATIAPVEAMHAAILNFVLGQYPVPASFLTTTNAVPPSDLTV